MSILPSDFFGSERKKSFHQCKLFLLEVLGVSRVQTMDVLPDLPGHISKGPTAWLRECGCGLTNPWPAWFVKMVAAQGTRIVKCGGKEEEVFKESERGGRTFETAYPLAVLSSALLLG